MLPGGGLHRLGNVPVEQDTHRVLSGPGCAPPFLHLPAASSPQPLAHYPSFRCPLPHHLQTTIKLMYWSFLVYDYQEEKRQSPYSPDTALLLYGLEHWECMWERSLDTKAIVGWSSDTVRWACVCVWLWWVPQRRCRAWICLLNARHMAERGASGARPEILPLPAPRRW